MTSRIDKDVKGQNELFWNGLIEVVKKNKKIKFIFLSWGNSVEEYINKFQFFQCNLSCYFTFFLY